MGHAVFDECYRHHSLDEGPGASQRQEPVICGGYGARPKMAGTARQTASAWVGAGLAKLYYSAGIPPHDSIIAVVGMGNLPPLGNFVSRDWTQTTHLGWA